MFGLSELAMILVVVAVVLGFRKLPELARSAGKAARIFKSEAGALGDRDEAAPGADRVIVGTVVDRHDTAPRS
ncbi:twin-arginine translocase TatA/TatE family subunit [Streptomyces sp. NPDC048521]|uniref:twin-arginine translocase TatA/TatE family subunit n=1 Tax=Streptomyces sp. NPDC048521 TaxID=3365566 RepID=UPI0037235E8A